MMKVKRFGILSVANISGILLAVTGLVFGLLYALIFAIMYIAEGGMYSDFSEFGDFGIGFMAVIFIIIIPVFYGVLGFLMGLIGAALYNVFAGWIGGIKVELIADQVVEL